jgi:hypothetical protein
VRFDGQGLDLWEKYDSSKNPGQRCNMFSTTPSQNYASAIGVIACDELTGFCFDRAGGWFRNGKPLKLDPALAGIVVKRLLPLAKDEFLCLDAAGHVRLLKLAQDTLMQSSQWDTGLFADIAVARVGKETPSNTKRLETPLAWALTEQGKLVCLDPSRCSYDNVDELIRRRLQEILNSSYPMSAVKTNPPLSIDVPGGMCSELPHQVKISSKQASSPISYALYAFRGMVRLEPKKGTLASGESLEFPAGATTVALELTQGHLWRRVLWTLEPKTVYPQPFSRFKAKNEQWFDNRYGFWVATDPEHVWSVDPAILKILVEEGLSKPGEEVTVSAAGKKLWRPDMAMAREKKDKETAMRQRRDEVQKLLPHRTVVRNNRDGQFFQAQDWTLYGYHSYARRDGDAIVLMQNWNADRRPAIWDEQILVDDAGQAHQHLEYSSSGLMPLDEHVPQFNFRNIAPNGTFVVGLSLSGDVWDVEGNLWTRLNMSSATDRPEDHQSNKYPPLPASLQAVDVVWLSYEANGWSNKKRNRIVLLEDGTLVALYYVQGKFKYIHLTGTDWKDPEGDVW